MTSHDPEPTAGLGLHVHNIAIQTADFDRSYHFYANVLRLPVVREPYTFKGHRQLAWLDGGSVLIELYSVRQSRVSSPYDPDCIGPDHIAFEVNDLDVMLNTLELAGYKPIDPPFFPPSGDPRQPRVVFIAGPDGEEIQFREPPL